MPNRRTLKRCLVALAMLCMTAFARAQEVADPGFHSVGRGAPLASVLPTPRLPINFGVATPDDWKHLMDDLQHYPFVGPLRLAPRGAPPDAHLQGVGVGSAWDGAAPPGVQPLPIDIFTSKDFYKDKDLWKDPRYFRCNSPEGLEMQRGAIFAPTIGKDPPRSAAWGRCDRDYPRAAIVSPYPFKTAQEHYEALLAETKRRGGPTQHTFATVPGEIGGRYAPGNFFGNWYAVMLAVQTTTVLSVLTPEYQQRLVQDLYHQGNTNAPQCPPSTAGRKASCAAGTHSPSSFRKR